MGACKRRRYADFPVFPPFLNLRSLEAKSHYAPFFTFFIRGVPTYWRTPNLTEGVPRYCRSDFWPFCPRNYKRQNPTLFLATTRGDGRLIRAKLLRFKSPPPSPPYQKHPPTLFNTHCLPATTSGYVSPQREATIVFVHLSATTIL